MKEYKDYEEENDEIIDVHFDSWKWLIKEAQTFIHKYNMCKTKREKNLLKTKMKYLQGKMKFELGEINKIITS